MHKTNIIILVFAFLISTFSCADAPDFSIEPEISFVGFSRNEVSQSAGNEESFVVSIRFTDGDGDIGIESDSIQTDLLFIDNRTGFTYDVFKSPAIPEQGSNNGLRGQMDILVFSTCCIFPDLTPPCTTPLEPFTNELSFDITLTDRAGNVSNVLTTPPITLLCD